MEQGSDNGSPAIPLPTTGDDVDQAIQELGAPADGASVKIFRFDPSTGKFAYLQAVPAIDCNLEMTREKFGGGRFKFVIIPPGGKNIRTVMQTIAGDPKDGRGNGSAPASSDLDDLREMIRAQAATIERLAASIGQAPSRDPIETALRILEVLNARAPAAAPGASVKDMLDIFKQGVEIGTGQGAGEGDPMGKMIDNVFPKLFGLLERSVENDEKRSASVVGRAKLPAAISAGGGGNPGAPPAPGAPVPVKRSLQDTVRAYVRPIASRMEAGRDPSACSVWFLEELSNDHVAELTTLAARPSFVSDALAIFPEIRAANEPWITDFLSAIKEQLCGQEDESPQT